MKQIIEGDFLMVQRRGKRVSELFEIITPLLEGENDAD